MEGSKKTSLILESFIVIGSIILLGVLFHKLFEWSQYNFWVGLISPINESKWEHWKIVFWPVLIVYIIRSWVFKKGTFPYVYVVIYIMLFQLITFGLLEIDELIFGTAEFPVHITLYVLGAVIGYWISQKYLGVEYSQQAHQLALLILLLEVALFVIITMNPPDKAYFEDPTSQQSGIAKEDGYGVKSYT